MPGGRVPRRLTMAVGDFEGLSHPMAEAAGTRGQLRFPDHVPHYSGGHDDCWWAAMLLDDLAADTRRDTLPDDTDTGGC